jgi:hypothetical protein
MTVPIAVVGIPLPQPLQEVPAPPPPRIVRKKGVPLATVGLIVGGLLLAGGATIALLYKGPPPIHGIARSSADGKDLLHLSCDAKSCADGTTVAEPDGAKATFAAGEADLPVSKPLRIGENDLSLVIDRPGMGRDETVKLHVPVAYRVRADVTTMTQAHPAITVRVEAVPGTDVRIDDKPVALDVEGTGAYVVDESAATEGPADESKPVSVDAAYVIAPKGGTPEKGTASARVTVAPLRVDAPLPHAIVDQGRVVVAGRAAKGATVTLDGAAVTVGPDGAFEGAVAIDAPGDKTIEVRAGTPTLMPRTVHLLVSRAASLADAAADFEKKTLVDYDTAMRDVQATVGQPMIVDGAVVGVSSGGRRTLLLVDDKRGCSKGPCLVRVIVVGGDTPPAMGDKLRAYGTVARSFSNAGKTLPEVEAQFVVRPSR